MFNQFLNGNNEQPKPANDYGGFFSQPLNPKPIAPEEEATPVQPPPPFMAESLDAYGNPYYGHGLQGYARKTFAKIFDPKNFLPAMDETMEVEYGDRTKDFASKLEQKFKWGSWIEKATGITAEEFAASSVAGQIGREEAENPTGERLSQTTGIAKRTVGAAVWAGLDAIGLTEKAARKVRAFSQAFDDIADTSTVLPDTPEFKGNGWASYANTLMTLNPFTPAYNFLRVMTSETNNFGDVLDLTKKYAQGSEAIYTLGWDDQKKAEFIRRLDAGENPDLLAIELQNPWTELGGSVFFDPLNLVGAKIPFTKVKLPSLSEILGINVGVKRVTSTAELFTKVQDDLAPILKNLETVTNHDEDIAKFRDILQNTSKTIAAKAEDYSFLAYTSDAKADLTKKTVGTVFQALAGLGKSPDDTMEMFSAMRKLVTGSESELVEAVSTLKKAGPLPFSQAGMQTIHFMNRVIENIDVGALAKKHADDAPGFTNEISEKLFSVVNDTFPSISDMKEADKAVKLGKATDKQIKLAQQLSKVSPWVVKATNVAEKMDVFYKPMNKFFAGIYMGYSPAYAIRNVLSNTVPMMVDLGVDVGVKSLVEGVQSVGQSVVKRLTKSEKANQFVAKNTAAIEKVLGGATYMTKKGISSAEDAGSQAIFSMAASEAEQVASTLIIRNVVEREMERALRNGAIPSLDSLTKAGFSQAESSHLFKTLLENFGDTKKSVKALREAMSEGSFELFRNLEVDPKLKDFLRKTSLWDSFDDIRKTSTNPDELMKRADELVQQVKQMANKARDEASHVAQDTPGAESVTAVQEAAQFLKGGEEEANAFTAVVETWRQARDKAEEAVDHLSQHIARNLNPDVAKAFASRIVEWKQGNKSADRMAKFGTDFLHTLSERARKGEDLNKLWADASYYYDDVVMDEAGSIRTVRQKLSLSEAFPNQTAPVSAQQFRETLWTWGKEQQSKFWRSYSEKLIDFRFDQLETMASQAGMNIDEVAADYFKADSNPLSEAKKLMKQAQEWEDWVDPKDFAKAVETDETQVVKLAKQYGISTATEAGKRNDSKLLNIINKHTTRAAVDGVEQVGYKSLKEVPPAEAAKALENYRVSKGLPEVVKPVPTRAMEQAPTTARALLENFDGFESAFRNVMEDTASRWGETAKLDNAKLTPAMEEALTKFTSEVDARVTTARAATAAIADETRNFILHDYNKTYLDAAFAYLSPYHYWANRTYMRWAERAVDNPAIMVAYSRYKEKMNQINSDQPEWWRYNMKVTLPGMEQSPMFFNLEQTLNPLNGITGVDFDDRAKRVDWFSSVVDDMGKLGPALFTPIQWGMAYQLYLRGEEDAAKRWAGRLFPQTQVLKSILNKTGISEKLPDIMGLKYGEIDPIINIIDGGLDPYEEKRVGRALGMMIGDGVPAELAIDASLNRDNELWDTAVRNALNERAGGQIASFFLGVGFKNRTQGDMDVDNFYNEYYRLTAVREYTAPDEYRNQMDALREKYAQKGISIDTVLISQRAGDQRYEAYAYNVLGRIPPGHSSEFFEMVDVDPETAAKFYENKGNLSFMPESERQRFMAGIYDLGAMLAIPKHTTKLEWNNAKSGYAEVQKMVKDTFGPEIFDSIDFMYSLDKNQRENFLMDHPEVEEALRAQEMLVMKNPAISGYYGGLETINSYYRNLMFDDLEKQYGKDVQKNWNEYYDILDPKERKKYLAAHPEMKKWQDDKKKLQEKYLRESVHFAQLLPDKANAELRDSAPETPQQQALQDYVNNNQPTYQTWTNALGEDMMELIAGYWYSGEKLPSTVTSELDYIAEQFGMYSGDELLQNVLITLPQQ